MANSNHGLKAVAMPKQSPLKTGSSDTSSADDESAARSLTVAFLPVTATSLYGPDLGPLDRDR